MTSIFDKVKDEIIKAQLAVTPDSRLLDGIVDGREPLLSEDEIIARLGISREEFTSWVRENDPYYKVKKGSIDEFKAFAGASRQTREIGEPPPPSFPKPDLYIASKARWRKKTFRNWLEHNMKTEWDTGE